MRKDRWHHKTLKKAGVKYDLVLKCWGLGYGDMQLDWHCGEYTQITQSVIESPEFQTIVNECSSRAELLWAGGQACIRVVCICDQSTRTSPSIVFSSTLQAVFQHAGFNSIGPLELVSVGLSSSATYAGSASHTCSVEVERGFHVVCPLTSESLVGVRR